jgi:hypothetical protein
MDMTATTPSFSAIRIWAVGRMVHRMTASNTSMAPEYAGPQMSMGAAPTDQNIPEKIRARSGTTSGDQQVPGISGRQIVWMGVHQAKVNGTETIMKSCVRVRWCDPHTKGCLRSW